MKKEDLLLMKIFQNFFKNLVYNDISVEKLENLLKEVLPPENLDGLEANKVNSEIRRKIAHQTKSLDLKSQNLQKLILKSLLVLSTTGKTLYEHRSEKALTTVVALIKATVKSCADPAVFLGKANEDNLTYRREKIKPELNQN